MSRDSKEFWVAIAVGLGVGSIILFLFGVGTRARADEINCPPTAPSCKVITMTPDEIQTLVGPNMIFDMAKWSSRPLGDLTDAWKKKIETAPAGKVREPESAPTKP